MDTEEMPSVTSPKVPDNGHYHPRSYGTLAGQDTSDHKHAIAESSGNLQRPAQESAPGAVNGDLDSPAVSKRGATIQTPAQTQTQRVLDATTHPSSQTQRTRTETTQAQVATTNTPTTFATTMMKQTSASTEMQHQAKITALPTETAISHQKATHTNSSAYAAIGICLGVGMIAGFIFIFLRKKRHLGKVKQIGDKPDNLKPGPTLMDRLNPLVTRVSILTRTASQAVTMLCKRSPNTKKNGNSECSRLHPTVTSKLFVQSKTSLQSVMGRLKYPSAAATIEDCSSVYSRRTDLHRSKFSQSIDRVTNMMRTFKRASPRSSLTGSSASTIADQPGVFPKPASVSSMSGSISFDGIQNVSPLAPSTLKVYAVEMDFDPAQDGQLKMEIGQSIKIYQVFDHGWVYGLNRETGQEGLAPRACLSTWPTSRAESGITMFPGSRNFSGTSFGSSIPGTQTGRFYNQFAPTG
ncbi:hypothetical protein BBP40_008828 [Aspergillus hancockii]|nr:hypothetical protein BBP40_008828 [Aspergillus hancockii]